MLRYKKPVESHSALTSTRRQIRCVININVSLKDPTCVNMNCLFSACLDTYKGSLFEEIEGRLL